MFSRSSSPLVNTGERKLPLLRSIHRKKGTFLYKTKTRRPSIKYQRISCSTFFPPHWIDIWIEWKRMVLMPEFISSMSTTWIIISYSILFISLHSSLKLSMYVNYPLVVARVIVMQQNRTAQIIDVFLFCEVDFSHRHILIFFLSKTMATGLFIVFETL